MDDISLRHVFRFYVGTICDTKYFNVDIYLGPIICIKSFCTKIAEKKESRKVLKKKKVEKGMNSSGVY